jgi:hypothetical protein
LLDDPSTSRTENAGRMGFIHNEVSILAWKEPFRDFKKIPNWSNVSIHTVDRFNDNKDVSMAIT